MTESMLNDVPSNSDSMKITSLLNDVQALAIKPFKNKEMKKVSTKHEFPKIRVNQDIYSQLRMLQTQYKKKSLGQVILMLIDTYNSYNTLIDSNERSMYNNQFKK